MPVPMLMVVNDYKKLVEAGADLEIQGCRGHSAGGRPFQQTGENYIAPDKTAGSEE